MPSASDRIPVRLARSVSRLLLVPSGLFVVGAIAIAAGLLVAGGAPSIALVSAGALAIVAGLVLAAILLSIGVQVVDDGLRVASLVGERHHVLAPGPVTRLTLRGPDAVPLRGGGIGSWAFGRARLRGRERVWVVRLAPVDTIVLVPTDRGRLALAAVSEAELLEALAEIGRRQDADDAPQPEAVTVPTAPAPPPAPEPIVPRLLTGIERSIVADLLEIARAEDEAAALRRAQDEAARQESGTITPVETPAPPVQSRSREPRRWFRRRGTTLSAAAEAMVPAAAPGEGVAPGEIELHAPEALLAAAPGITAVSLPEAGLQPIVEAVPVPLPGVTGTTEPALEPAEAPEQEAPGAIAAHEAPAAPVEAPATSVLVAAPPPVRTRPRKRRSRLRRRLDRLVALPPAARVLGIALIAAPIVIALAAWFGAERMGTLPEGIAAQRSVALALLLAGPVAALAAIVARMASPRLIGLVLLSAGAALLLIGRALVPW